MEMGLGNFFEASQLKVAIKTNIERFVAHFGCLPVNCAMIWEDLQRTKTTRARVKRRKAIPMHFLMMLHHLKVYPTELQAEGQWSLTRKTYRKWVKFFLKKLRRLKAEKIVWPDDWAEDEVWVVTVDGTHCWINEPKHPEFSQDRKFYSHKFNKAGILYELASDIATSRLVWMNGPFRAGTNDVKIFRKHGLMVKLASIGKKAIGDKGYSGKEYKHVMSIFNAHDDYCVKKFKSRALKRQETFNGMTKRFGALDGRFRHGPKQFQYYFESICIICQYQIENSSPLYDVLIEAILED